jgi:hypothetical protein
MSWSASTSTERMLLPQARTSTRTAPTAISSDSSADKEIGDAARVLTEIEKALNAASNRVLDDGQCS